MKRPLKVALVCPYDVAFPGGVSAHVQNLSANLENNGVVTSIIAPASAGYDNSIPNLIQMGSSVTIPTGGSLARISFSVWLAEHLRNLIRQGRYDVVHLHEPFAGALTLSILSKNLENGPIKIGTFHSFEGSNLYKIVPDWLLQKYFRRLDGRIAVSEPAKSYVQKYLPSKYEVIPNGIDVNEIHSVKPYEQLLDGKVNILFLGRLEKRKGLRYLLSSFCDLKWKFPHIRLIVVGTGEMDSESQRILGERNPDDVLFVGSVTHEQKLRYLKTADIFCSPATGQESFGIVLLEAMSAGLPIVASRIDGYASLLGEEEAFLFRAGDSIDLSEKLAILIGDKQMRNQMGRHGRNKSELFDWSVVTERILNYYLSFTSILDSNRLRNI